MLVVNVEIGANSEWLQTSKGELQVLLFQWSLKPFSSGRGLKRAASVSQRTTTTAGGRTRKAPKVVNTSCQLVHDEGGQKTVTVIPGENTLV